MDNPEIQHLQELKEAYKVRLRALELQVAQRGVECPASIQIEVKEIKKSVISIERQLDMACVDRNYILLAERQSQKGFVKRLFIGVIFVLVSLSVLTGLLFPFYPIRLFKLYPTSTIDDLRGTQSSPTRQSLPFVGDSSQSDISEAAPKGYTNTSVEAISVHCIHDVVTVFLRSGIVVWENLELDQTSSTVMPPGTRLRMFCDTDFGHVQIMLVRVLVEKRNKLHPVWILETYHCIGCMHQHRSYVYGGP